MGYELHGLIGAGPVVAAAAARLAAPVVDLAHGFALVPGPLLDPDSDTVPACSWPVGKPFWWLASTWEGAAVTASVHGPVAYVEADLFGGAGTQAAVVWHDRMLVLGPVTTDRSTPRWPRRRSRTPVEQALHALVGPGVPGAPGVPAGNPFDALGLGRHRATRDWVPDARP